MENFRKDLQVALGTYSEEEVISRAREVLGDIPGWYWEHKEVIKKNRIAQSACTGRIVREINEMLQKLERMEE